MSTTFERPPDDAEAFALLTSGGLDSSPVIEANVESAAMPLTLGAHLALGALPLGAHLVLRCRKDWRTATVIRVEPDRVTLSVSSPTGRTYRMRRPPDAPLIFDGHIPLLGEIPHSCWRAGLARYDVRW